MRCDSQDFLRSPAVPVDVKKALHHGHGERPAKTADRLSLHCSLEQDFIADLNPPHSRLFFLVEIKTQHISFGEIEIIQVLSFRISLPLIPSSDRLISMVKSDPMFQGLFSFAPSSSRILAFRCFTSVTPARLKDWKVFMPFVSLFTRQKVVHIRDFGNKLILNQHSSGGQKRGHASLRGLLFID